MSAWISMFKKDFRVGLPALLFTIISFIVIEALAAYLGGRNGMAIDAIIAVSFILIAAHILYLICYIFFSLQAERKKLHLWLHNPLPGYSLLLSKLLNGIIAMSITLFLSSSVVLLGIASMGDIISEEVSWKQIFSIGIFTEVNLYLFAIDLAVWFIFSWMIYRMLTRRLGIVMSLIITLGITALIIYLYAKFETTGLYTTLTQWGEIPLAKFIQYGTNFQAESMSFSTQITESVIHTGTYVFEAIIAVILFFISSWILDRKVEV